MASDPHSGDPVPLGDARLRVALAEANVPTLQLALVQLTGDERWLQEPYRPKRGRPLDDNDSAGLPEEYQARYVLQAIGQLIANDLHSMDVREPVFQGYNKELDEALSRSIWVHPGMTTYYRNNAGRVVVSSPWTYLDYWYRILRFDPAEYEKRPRSSTPAPGDEPAAEASREPAR